MLLRLLMWAAREGPAWLAVSTFYENAFEDGRNDAWQWSLSRPLKKPPLGVYSPPLGGI